MKTAPCRYEAAFVARGCTSSPLNAYEQPGQRRELGFRWRRWQLLKAACQAACMFTALLSKGCTTQHNGSHPGSGGSLDPWRTREDRVPLHVLLRMKNSLSRATCVMTWDDMGYCEVLRGVCMTPFDKDISWLHKLSRHDI